MLFATPWRKSEDTKSSTINISFVLACNITTNSSSSPVSNRCLHPILPSAHHHQNLRRRSLSTGCGVLVSKHQHDFIHSPTHSPTTFSTSNGDQLVIIEAVPVSMHDLSTTWPWPRFTSVPHATCRGALVQDRLMTALATTHASRSLPLLSRRGNWWGRVRAAIL